ncbi:dienelactone hydrolase domain-containing protein [Hesseltinella vesiculosa]|uniref:Dienelactone hydrolase domain-containing protein n=1 Tax=Hesseltinella vesiculosa TaxID=101127 RepID=A0A1X2GVL9_9FUNG|nr:dienelactone hydrolase domain-containing protein [Hesseltinella vesiculosa]
MMQPQKVSFDSHGHKIAGHLYLPKDKQVKNQAGVVISHPMTGVKEQTAGLYASELCKLGFVALTFDAAYQGESEGLPRALEDPWQRSEDVKNAVTFLETLDDVDPEKIGALGICASGGYVPFAAQTDVRIKAVAGVSAADVGSLFRDGYQFSTTPEQLQQMLAQSAKDRTNEAKGQPPRLEWVLPRSKEDADKMPARSLFQEAYDYYLTPRAQHPNAIGQYLFRSVDMLVQFSAYDYVSLISPRPLLMIAGSDADTLYFSKAAIEKAKEPKELFIIDGASHVDMYDIPQYVAAAVQKLDQFFTQHLTQ